MVFTRTLSRSCSCQSSKSQAEKCSFSATDALYFWLFVEFFVIMWPVRPLVKVFQSPLNLIALTRIRDIKDRSTVLQTLFSARLVELHLRLLETKCIPVLLYGLEACPLTKNQLSSSDFVLNRFFMKLFKSSNIAVINECQKMFFFQLPSERLNHRTSRFLSKVALIDNNIIKYTTHV